MRRIAALLGMTGLGLSLGGCPFDPQGALLGGSASGRASSDAVAGALVESPRAVAGGRMIGAVSPTNKYETFSLGAAALGEELTVAGPDSLAGSFTVAMFDENFDLVRRAVVSAGAPLVHVLRESTGQVYVGVAVASGTTGGAFDMRVSKRTGVNVPVPRPQRVYLNFAGGQDVQVHTRPAVSFGPFAAEAIGEAYAGATDRLKSVIVEEVSSDYAAFDVTFLTSDGPLPSGDYSVVHFGGADGGLLGLADSVDQYNQRPSEDAIIYVGSFANFSGMNLSVDEMALMIANVASHELGHLLGLYHTRDPSDVMDTTGSAWDLAGNQTFSRAALESSVFPTGMENSPKLLGFSVGPAKNGELKLKNTLDGPKMIRRAAIRRLVSVEMRHACGTCLNLDE